MLICQRTDEYNPIRLIFHLSSLFEKAKFNTVQAAIAKNCSRNALNKSTNDISNPSISIENKFGKLNGKRLIFEKSHIPTNRCSHKDNQWGTREDRLYSFSTTSMKVEHNFKTFISITYSSVQPLPFLSSPITLLPTITKRPRNHYHSPLPGNCAVYSQCPGEMPAVLPHCINSHLWLAARLFLTAATPVFPLTGFLWDSFNSPYHSKTSSQSSFKTL